MRKSEFLKHINQLGEEELRQELTLLFDKLAEVKLYYKMELGNEKDRKRIYSQAKKDIASKYKTKSIRKPRRPRIQKVQKILRELERQTVFNYELIDIYLYDVECALQFAHKYDYFTQVLFNNISRSFERACELIEQNRLYKDYSERCDNILLLSRYIRELNKNLNAIYTSKLDSSS